MADNPVVSERPCRECGQAMRRDVRGFTITYQGLSSRSFLDVSHARLVLHGAGLRGSDHEFKGHESFRP